MKYNISRLEKNRNHNGDITSIFLAVSINDEVAGEGTYYEHWLTPEEKDLVLADETNLKPILAECYAQAELKLENEIATRPMPKIEPLKEVGKREALEALVKKTDITNKKKSIKKLKV